MTTTNWHYCIIDSIHFDPPTFIILHLALHPDPPTVWHSDLPLSDAALWPSYLHNGAPSHLPQYLPSAFPTLNPNYSASFQAHTCQWPFATPITWVISTLLPSRPLTTRALTWLKSHGVSMINAPVICNYITKLFHRWKFPQLLLLYPIRSCTFPQIPNIMCTNVFGGLYMEVLTSSYILCNQPMALALMCCAALVCCYSVGAVSSFH